MRDLNPTPSQQRIEKILKSLPGSTCASPLRYSAHLTMETGSKPSKSSQKRKLPKVNTSQDFVISQEYQQDYSGLQLDNIVIQGHQSPTAQENSPSRLVKVSKLIHNRYRHSNIFPKRNAQRSYETES